MELWTTLFARCGKGVFSFSHLVNDSDVIIVGNTLFKVVINVSLILICKSTERERNS